MWRLWMVRLMPFMGRWLDAAPAACCGVCPTCLTATASGLTISVIGSKLPRSEEDEPTRD